MEAKGVQYSRPVRRITGLCTVTYHYSHVHSSNFKRSRPAPAGTAVLCIVPIIGGWGFGKTAASDSSVRVRVRVEQLEPMTGIKSHLQIYCTTLFSLLRCIPKMTREHSWSLVGVA
jgi:hypothetical protein